MNDVKTIVENTQALMEKAIAHLEVELQKVRAGKASPAMLENILVDYYFLLNLLMECPKSKVFCNMCPYIFFHTQRSEKLPALKKILKIHIRMEARKNF